MLTLYVTKKISCNVQKPYFGLKFYKMYATTLVRAIRASHARAERATSLAH